MNLKNCLYDALERKYQYIGSGTDNIRGAKLGKGPQFIRGYIWKKIPGGRGTPDAPKLALRAEYFLFNLRPWLILPCWLTYKSFLFLIIRYMQNCVGTWSDRIRRCRPSPVCSLGGRTRGNKGPTNSSVWPKLRNSSKCTLNNTNNKHMTESVMRSEWVGR